MCQCFDGESVGPRRVVELVNTAQRRRRSCCRRCSWSWIVDCFGCPCRGGCPEIQSSFNDVTGSRRSLWSACRTARTQGNNNNNKTTTTTRRQHLVFSHESVGRLPLVDRDFSQAAFVLLSSRPSSTVIVIITITTTIVKQGIDPSFHPSFVRLDSIDGSVRNDNTTTKAPAFTPRTTTSRSLTHTHSSCNMSILRSLFVLLVGAVLAADAFAPSPLMQATRVATQGALKVRRLLPVNSWFVRQCHCCCSCCSYRCRFLLCPLLLAT